MPRLFSRLRRSKSTSFSQLPSQEHWHDKYERFEADSISLRYSKSCDKTRGAPVNRERCFHLSTSGLGICLFLGVVVSILLNRVKYLCLL